MRRWLRRSIPDEATIGVLRFLAHEAGRESILILGAYRDMEVGRDDPLAEALADLPRQAAFERQQIEGFTRGEVRELITRYTATDPRPELVETVMDRTDGNPLFATELIRSLHARSETTSDDPNGLGVPSSLGEVILGRLAQLSPACQEAVTVASVMGRDLTPALIEALADSAHDVDEAIEEARRAGMVQDGHSHMS